MFQDLPNFKKVMLDLMAIQETFKKHETAFFYITLSDQHETCLTHLRLH